ncbi:FAD-dependent oxidoreductase [Novosphingobium sp. KCTC 2891]|uniref:FAD-dependent oxidoreductase n=1 Tax=Novosphingobium sp. KCTC 2891 TaxID=2989730 RepID=UPI002223924F|nr:FAD-dependent oxidoreductase [Novosphingobium sp. KCTC 2891]MCW1384479.1 FAD-dependent oxidoreductase [Novosphingobium sp. KCTC 2891]
MANWDRQVDVIVIGLGIAGACAALEAKRAGADVLVLERASAGGGASALSQGIFYLGGSTPVQEACGYTDTAENLYRFLRASTSHPDDAVIRTFAEGARDHFDWLEAQGVPFTRTGFSGKAVYLQNADCLLTTGNEKIWPFKDEAKPVPRGHQARSDEVNGGLSAMRALLAQCEAEGIAAEFDTAVSELITDASGTVVGVVAKAADAPKQRIAARRGVIVATGSFTNNPALVRRWLTRLSATSEPLGIPSNDGAGLALAEAVGGALAAMDGVIATASLYPPEDLIKGIVVNARGERFVAEDSYHGRLAGFIMEQPDQKAWLIVDSEIFAYPGESTGHTLVDGFETIGDIGPALGLPEGALDRTIAQYNHDTAQGEDSAFHKQPPWLKPLDKAPYAVFDISFDRSTYRYISLGGIDTDAHARVLDADGRPIPGLYAAGACAAHIPRSGKEYASGLSLGPGSFFGRVAGREAAARTEDLTMSEGKTANATA